MSHALVVDDDADSAETLALLIADEGFTVATAGTLRDARRQLALQEARHRAGRPRPSGRQRHGPR